MKNGDEASPGPCLACSLPPARPLWAVLPSPRWPPEPPSCRSGRPAFNPPGYLLARAAKGTKEDPLLRSWLQNPWFGMSSSVLTYHSGSGGKWQHLFCRNVPGSQ